MLGIAVVLVATSFTASASATMGAIFDPAGSISATSSAVTFEGSGVRVICPVTLSGTFDEDPIAVESGTLGSISGVTVGRCTNGTFGSALGLPWTMNLQGGLGTLPEAATGLRVTIPSAALSFSQFGAAIGCLYAGEIDLLMALGGTGDPYTTTSLSALREAIPRIAGGGTCPLSITMTGGFTIAQQAVALGGGDYEPSVRDLRFGEVTRNTTVERTIRLANRTMAQVRITAIQIGSTVYRTEPSGAFNIGPEKSSPVVIRFTPTAVQEYNTTIRWLEGGVVKWEIMVRGRGK
jgi:hypothetical protein